MVFHSEEDLRAEIERRENPPAPNDEALGEPDEPVNLGEIEQEMLRAFTGK
jgi:hypothetical protein